MLCLSVVKLSALGSYVPEDRRSSLTGGENLFSAMTTTFTPAMELNISPAEISRGLHI